MLFWYIVGFLSFKAVDIVWYYRKERNHNHVPKDFMNPPEC